jgi:hypothetical protein
MSFDIGEREQSLAQLVLEKMGFSRVVRDDGEQTAVNG